MASAPALDYEFVPELPDEYFCIICQCVLNKPKQIEECGHRFCESCINDLFNHSNYGGSLLCPIDRQAITGDQIFKDKATERVILNWNVKCPNNVHGCKWIGEFHSVKNHEEKCNNNTTVKETPVDYEALLDQLHNLSKKVEELSTVKTELAEVKSQFQQVKSEYAADKKIITELRINVNILMSLRKEIKELTVKSQDLQKAINQNEEVKTKEVKLSHSGDTNSSQLRNYNKPLNPIVSQLYHLNLANTPVKDSEDPRTLIKISEYPVKFQWKCPAFIERDINKFSPLIWFKSNCYQLSWYLSKYDRLYIYLFQCKNVTDVTVGSISTDSFKCHVSIRHSTGNIDFTTVLKSAINRSSSDRSVLNYKLLMDNFHYLIDGFYHVACMFQDD